MRAKKKIKIPEGVTLVKTTSLNSMADNIASIANAVRDLSGEGKLTEDALVTLIERNCEPPSGYHDKPVSRRDIMKVLQSLRTLDNFVQKKKAPSND